MKLFFSCDFALILSFLTDLHVLQQFFQHLPSVSYQIKMQRILNEYFYGLLFLVLESLFVYVLKVRFDIPWTGYIDALAAFTALFHNIFTQLTYYNDAKRIKKKVMDVSSPKPQRQSSAIV